MTFTFFLNSHLTYLEFWHYKFDILRVFRNKRVILTAGAFALFWDQTLSYLQLLFSFSHFLFLSQLLRPKPSKYSLQSFSISNLWFFLVFILFKNNFSAFNLSNLSQTCVLLFCLSHAEEGAPARFNLFQSLRWFSAVRSTQVLIEFISLIDANFAMHANSITVYLQLLEFVEPCFWAITVKNSGLKLSLSEAVASLTMFLSARSEFWLWILIIDNFSSKKEFLIFNDYPEFKKVIQIEIWARIRHELNFIYDKTSQNLS